MKYYHYYPRALIGNGGPTVAMWSWVRALKEADQTIAVVCDADFMAPQPLAVPDVRVIPLTHRMRGRWRFPVGLGSHLSSDTILIVHSAFLMGNLVAAKVATRAGAKTIFTPHGAYDHDARRRSAFLKKIWLSFESFIIEKSLAVHGFVDTEIASIREVMPTVPIIIAPTPVDIPKNYKWQGGGGYIAWFGRYDIEHKGLDLLIEAYRRIPKEIRIPMRLHGRNSTNTRSDVMTLVENAKLSDMIFVGGPIEGNEKLEFLTLADFFVMPSRWESFSIALLEVLALNIPSIVSDAMPISGQLKKEHACIVSSIEPTQLAANLECILLNQQELIETVFPRRFVEKNLTHEVVGHNFARQVDYWLRKCHESS